MSGRHFDPAAASGPQLAGVRRTMSSERKVIIQGSIISLIGFGLAQILRFGSNLVLSRLLFPEAFALSGLVATVLVGFQMLSDLGLGTAVVTHREAVTKRYLDNVWTLQVIRAAGLTLLACLLAPAVALFFEQPELGPLLYFASITIAVSGFVSPGMHMASREMRVKQLAIIELIAQAAAVVLMIGWSLIQPTYWALVGGSVVSAFVKVVASYLLLPTHRPRFRHDKQHFASLLGFSRWIFLATAMTYLGSHGHRAVLGKMLDLRTLGAFMIAAALAGMVDQCRNLLNARILLPTYSQVLKCPPQIRIAKIRKLRLLLTAVLLPLSCGLMVFGDVVIGFLYDARYAAAGTMLQILAVGSTFSVITNIGPVVLAARDSRLHMLCRLNEAVLTVGLMVVAGMHFGSTGVLWSIPLSRLAIYPIEAAAARTYSGWLPKTDCWGAISACGLLTVGMLLKELL